MSTKRPAVPANDRRTSQAVELFEKAVKAVGRKDYDKAREHLDALIASHPDERDVLERARTYRTVCERALGEGRRSSSRPRDFEELVNHGVFLHNRGDFEEAQKALRQAADQQPKNEHVLYCLAAAAARAGDSAAALKSLRAAIAAGPESRAHARRDPDFDSLRGDQEFAALLQSAS